MDRGGEGRQEGRESKKSPSIKYNNLKGCVSCAQDNKKNADMETRPNGKRYQRGVR